MLRLDQSSTCRLNVFGHPFGNPIFPIKKLDRDTPATTAAWKLVQAEAVEQPDSGLHQKPKQKERMGASNMLDQEGGSLNPRMAPCNATNSSFQLRGSRGAALWTTKSNFHPPHPPPTTHTPQSPSPLPPRPP